MFTKEKIIENKRIGLKIKRIAFILLFNKKKT